MQTKLKIFYRLFIFWIVQVQVPVCNLYQFLGRAPTIPDNRRDASIYRMSVDTVRDIGGTLSIISNRTISSIQYERNLELNLDDICGWGHILCFLLLVNQIDNITIRPIQRNLQLSNYHFIGFSKFVYIDDYKCATSDPRLYRRYLIGCASYLSPSLPSQGQKGTV